MRANPPRAAESAERTHVRPLSERHSSHAVPGISPRPRRLRAGHLRIHALGTAARDRGGSRRFRRGYRPPD
ncbi:hypothetical protein BMH30_15600, partial [Leucobacter sp. OLES1]